jgi:hypothetical protein
MPFVNENIHFIIPPYGGVCQDAFCVIFYSFFDIQKNEKSKKRGVANRCWSQFGCKLFIFVVFAYRKEAFSLVFITKYPCRFL